MLTMINYRSLIVDKMLGTYTDCVGCYRAWVFSVDAKLIILSIIVLYISLVLKNYFLRLFLRILLTLFIGYYLIDIYLYKFLNQRLFLADILTYFNIETIIETVNRDLSSSSLLIFSVLLIFILMFIFFHQQLKFLKLELLLIGSVLIFLLIFILNVNKIDYINDVSIRNIVDINFNSTESNDYSEKTIKLINHKINDIESLSCKESKLNTQFKKKKNIVLLLWESLSMYQSELFSGMNNWTPHLDDIARNNRYYSNFFANNFTSLEGRLAILTGEKTFRNIAPMTIDRGRVGYWNSQRNLPKLLNANGYHTSFLDGANLDFTRTGDYMNGIGFDYVEGQEYEGYKNQQRYGFNSVSDEVLYNRVLEYSKQQNSPYFITIITVTTHPPYINPETGLSSIENATKYADKSFYKFYQKLENNNFFDDGVLIIMSDHRSMTPVSAEEIKKYGKQAVARIPLVVVDKDFSGNAQTNEYLQQSDLLNSIEYLVTNKHCRRKDEGNIFSDPAIPSACIYHNRGDYRDQIDVYCKNGMQSATVKLDGDNTRLIKGELDNSDEIVENINTSRIAARKRHDEFLLNQQN
jgi:phosphoglycerol transferase MdoB-like AlkP superfamily enzyme